MCVIFFRESERPPREFSSTNLCVLCVTPCRIRKALENKSNMEDDRVAALEGSLGQAKQIAEEADKKYEEVSTKENRQLIPLSII